MPIAAVIERSSRARLLISEVSSRRKWIIEGYVTLDSERLCHPASTLQRNECRYASHADLRRRLRHLPLLGRLLAGPDGRARRLPPVSGGGSRFPGDSSRGVSPRSSVRRRRWARLFGRGRHVPRAARRSRTCRVVVALRARARVRAGKRMGVCVLRAATRACSTSSRRACGGPRSRPERYELVSWVFLRLFGAIYVAAFTSLAVQIEGLVGHAGILPVTDFLDAAHRALGGAAYRIVPTLFWLNASDGALFARHRRRRVARIAGRRRPLDAPRADRPLRALPVLRLCRAGFHELPMGRRFCSRRGSWRSS